MLTNTDIHRYELVDTQTFQTHKCILTLTDTQVHTQMGSEALALTGTGTQTRDTEICPGRCTCPRRAHLCPAPWLAPCLHAPTPTGLLSAQPSRVECSRKPHAPLVHTDSYMEDSGAAMSSATENGSSFSLER